MVTLPSRIVSTNLLLLLLLLLYTVGYSTVQYNISTLNNFTLARSDDVFLHVTQTTNFPLGGPHFPVIRTTRPAILSGWPRNYCSVPYISISIFQSGDENTKRSESNDNKHSLDLTCLHWNISMYGVEMLKVINIHHTEKRPVWSWLTDGKNPQLLWYIYYG